MGKKKCQAGINKNASYWEWMVLPGKKKASILHFVWEKQRKEITNCFIKVLTYIQLKSSNLKSQMTHILAFLWKENYFPRGWLSNTMSLCRESKEHQRKNKMSPDSGIQSIQSKYPDRTLMIEICHKKESDYKCSY